MVTLLSMPILVSAQDDLLPPPDMLFAEPVETVTDTIVEEELSAPVMESVDELPALEDLPALDELPVVEDNNGIDISPSSPIEIIDEAPVEEVVSEPVIEESIPVEVIETPVEEIKVIDDTPVVTPSEEPIIVEEPEVIETVQEQTPIQEIAPEVINETVEPTVVEESTEVTDEQNELIKDEVVENETPAFVAEPVSSTTASSSWSINFNAGSNLFYGDIRVNDFMPVFENNNESKYAFGVILAHELNETLELRGQILYGQLSGTKREDKLGNPANIYFDATIFEYNANLKYIIPMSEKSSLYSYLGLGMVHFRTQKKNLITDAILGSYGYRGTEKTAPTIETVMPIGVGYNYKINQDFSFNADVSLRIVNTDKLDANISSSTSLFQDMYGYTSLGFTYNIGSQQTTVTESPSVAAVEMIEPAIDSIVEEPSLDTVVAEVEMVDTISAEIESTEVVEEVIETSAEPVLESPVIEIIDMQETQTESEVTSEPVVDASPETTLESPVIEIIDVQESKPETDAIPTPVVEVVEEEGVTFQIVDNTIPTVSETPTSGYANANATNGLVFRIQIVAVTTQKDNKVAQLKKLYGLNEVIYEDVVGTWYKYTVGNYATLQEAISYRKVLVEKGIKDSFIVPFYNGKRISLQEAKQLK